MNELSKQSKTEENRILIVSCTLMLISFILKYFLSTPLQTPRLDGYYDADNNIALFERNSDGCVTVGKTDEAVSKVYCRTEKGLEVKFLKRVDLVVTNQNILSKLWYINKTVRLPNGREVQCTSNGDKHCYLNIYDVNDQEQTNIKQYEISEQPIPYAMMQNNTVTVFCTGVLSLFITAASIKMSGIRVFYG